VFHKNYSPLNYYYIKNGNNFKEVNAVLKKKQEVKLLYTTTTSNFATENE